ncbi:MAG: bifunctional phosphopantothenoylcysteine decarboxylase/phosphopantothenate--cysteine ligase CoaBC [Acidimicrobiales bacterium]
MGDGRVSQSDHAALQGRVVVLGVTGGIAAYKAVEVCRRLVEAGAIVLPVLTAAATKFVGTMTFSALASEPARTDLFDTDDPLAHTRLASRADLVLVAPATANFLGEVAMGLAPDLLSATVLATKAPLLVAPAMHKEMWESDAVRHSVETLVARGVSVVGPDSGPLAGGDEGPGRLVEPEEIVAEAVRLLGEGQDLLGVTVLVTAGGTREPIDPVRVITNRSSGRQGYAIASAAKKRGATVTLVSAATLPPPSGVELVPVETAAELAEAVLERASAADVVVMAAAVADFRPKAASIEKLKKRDGPPEIVLEPTEDVLALLATSRRPGQILVGFAAETTDARREGERKLREKDVDLMVLNDVTQPGTGFSHETNAVTLLYRDGSVTEVAMAPKPTIAEAVLDAVVKLRPRSSHEE